MQQKINKNKRLISFFTSVYIFVEKSDFNEETHNIIIVVDVFHFK